MRNIEPITHGNYYHVYNCGINGVSLFREKKNYEFFLQLYEKYICPIADTYAWCLMGNHFHILIRIREENEIDLNRLYTSDRILYPVRGIKPPHIYFSHLFNSYAQAYNNMYARHGGLFERPFKRKLISSEKYFRRLVLYIHNNPVHHGFCEHPVEYLWSSYIGSISDKRIIVKQELLVERFNKLEDCKVLHKTKTGIIENEEP